MPDVRKMTATKAHVPSLGVLLAALLYQFLGVGDMPPPEDFRQALMAVFNAIGTGAATWLLAYFAPRNTAKLMVPLLAVFLVAACASTMAGLTPQQRVFALKGEFDIMLDQVVAYAEQPRCDAAVVVACSDGEVVAQAVDLAADADTALDQAEAVVRAGGSPADAASYAQIARAAVAQLSAYLIQKGVAP